MDDIFLETHSFLGILCMKKFCWFDWDFSGFLMYIDSTFWESLNIHSPVYSFY